jgi:hypothetical protein
MQKIEKMQKILNNQKINEKSSQFNDEIASLKEFSFDSLLKVDDSKKIKNKNRSSDLQNKKSDTFTRRDSSDFEFTETEFNQRVDEQSKRERRKRRDRDRSREQRRERRRERARE